jgi:hypothetical protein
VTVGRRRPNVYFLVHVLNVTDPADPQWVTTMYGPHRNNVLATDSGYLRTSGWESAQLHDVSTPQTQKRWIFMST